MQVQEGWKSNKHEKTDAMTYINNFQLKTAEDQAKEAEACLAAWEHAHADGEFSDKEEQNIEANIFLGGLGRRFQGYLVILG